MNEIRITNYNEIENIAKNKEEFTVNFEDCDIKIRKRVIDFLAGLTCRNGSITKINKDTFHIKVNNKNE